MKDDLEKTVRGSTKMEETAREREREREREKRREEKKEVG